MMMDRVTYDLIWELIQRELLTRCVALESGDFNMTPEGVKVLTDDMLLRMVVVGLLKRVDDLEGQVADLEGDVSVLEEKEVR